MTIELERADLHRGVETAPMGRAQIVRDNEIEALAKRLFFREAEQGAGCAVPTTNCS